MLEDELSWVRISVGRGLLDILNFHIISHGYKGECGFICGKSYFADVGMFWSAYLANLSNNPCQ